MFDWFGFFRRERESYDRDYGLTETGRIFWRIDLTSGSSPSSPMAR